LTNVLCLIIIASNPTRCLYNVKINGSRCQAVAEISYSAFESHTPASNGLLPLPISRTLYEDIAHEFNVSPNYLTVLSTGVATYISPSAGEGCVDWEHARKFNGVSSRPNKITVIGFVLQQNTSYSCYSMALSFNIKTGKTRVLIFGAQSWSLLEMFTYLGSVSPLPFGPIFIPTIAMELQAKWFNGTINGCHGKIYNIETTTGMRRLHNPSDSDLTKIQGWKKLDLIDIARDLNSILSRLAFFKLQAKTSTYLIGKMQLSVKDLKEVLENERQSFRNEIQDHILSKLEYIQSWFFGITARCSYLTERTQAQVQTVCSILLSWTSEF
jgi:hypothetical protein